MDDLPIIKISYEEFNKIIQNKSLYESLHGIYHVQPDPRLNGIYYTEEDVYYFVNGKHHREDGPAVEYDDGKNVFYIYGKRFSEEDYWKQIYLLKNGLESYE